MDQINNDEHSLGRDGSASRSASILPSDEAQRRNLRTVARQLVEDDRVGLLYPDCDAQLTDLSDQARNDIYDRTAEQLLTEMFGGTYESSSHETESLRRMRDLMIADPLGQVEVSHQQSIDSDNSLSRALAAISSQCRDSKGHFDIDAYKGYRFLSALAGMRRPPEYMGRSIVSFPRHDALAAVDYLVRRSNLTRTQEVGTDQPESPMRWGVADRLGVLAHSFTASPAAELPTDEQQIIRDYGAFIGQRAEGLRSQGAGASEKSDKIPRMLFGHDDEQMRSIVQAVSDLEYRPPGEIHQKPIDIGSGKPSIVARMKWVIPEK